jgi:hypothetical protein
MQIPQEIAEGVAEIIRQVCNQENGYQFITFMTIGDYYYKITITLDDVDPQKEAKIATITIKREE